MSLDTANARGIVGAVAVRGVILGYKLCSRVPAGQPSPQVDGTVEAIRAALREMRTEHANQ